MNLRPFVPCALVALGSLLSPCAHATTYNGTFAADNGVFSDPFTTTSAENFSAVTTSAAAGNFLPTLTLFNVTTGNPVDFTSQNTYPGGDVSLTETLAAGSYDLFLTEFPNVANGSLDNGFLYASDPDATGDYCGGALTGTSLNNAVTCSGAKLGKHYSLNVTATPATSPVPEPSSFLLMLAPATALVEVVRRRRLRA